MRREGGLLVSGVFTLMTTSSFLVQNTYGLDAQSYGLTFALNSIAFVVGTQVSARVLRRVSPRAVLQVSLPLLAVAGFAIIPAAELGIAGFVVAAAIFMLGAGLTVPCISVIGLGRHGHQAGTTAAFLGAVNFGLAGLTLPIVGAIAVTSATPMGALIGLTFVVAMAVFCFLVRPQILAGPGDSLTSRPSALADTAPLEPH